MGSDALELVLADLLEGSADPARAETVRQRDAALARSSAWAVHRPALVLALAGLRPGDAVPSGGETERIRASNRLHDDAGRALISYAEAVALDPGASAEEKNAAAVVLTEVLTGRSELVQSHATEIANARRRQPIIQARQAELRLIPAASGRTGLDLAHTIDTAAEERSALLAQRATAPGTPTAASSAWSRALGDLLDFRRTLRTEMAHNAALPANLETLVFGLLDAQR